MSLKKEISLLARKIYDPDTVLPESVEWLEQELSDFATQQTEMLRDEKKRLEELEIEYKATYLEQQSTIKSLSTENQKFCYQIEELQQTKEKLKRCEGVIGVIKTIINSDEAEYVKNARIEALIIGKEG